MKERDDHAPFEIGSGHPATILGTGRGARRWVIALAVFAVALGGGIAYLYLFERERAERWLEPTPFRIPPTVTQVYKWRDAQGNWHITDKPPPAGVRYERLEYRSDDNVLPLVPRD